MEQKFEGGEINFVQRKQRLISRLRRLSKERRWIFLTLEMEEANKNSKEVIFSFLPGYMLVASAWFCRSPSLDMIFNLKSPFFSWRFRLLGEGSGETGKTKEAE